MGKIVISECVSLDGVVEDPAGIEGFKHGGWTFEIERGDEGEDAAVGPRQEGVVSGALLRISPSRHPVVLGAGERLFGELSDKKPLRLVGARTVGDGVVIHTYEPVRGPGPGERHVPR